MKLKISILLLLAVCCGRLYAAIPLKGYIVDAENNKALEGVICQIWANKQAVRWTFSNETGYFSVTANALTDSLSFQMLGYERQIYTVSALQSNTELTIKLVPTRVALREIVVKPTPITARGDTISYNVSSFQSQQDQYVVDVLKKLPGISVDANGAIRYQGDPIDKFYIEGRDLLGSNYTIASNNLNVNAISNVDIIENNQHIRALQGITSSNRAAINLKLKKGFIAKPFGEVEAGLGGRPFLYSGRAFATFLTTQTQAIVSLKGNNTGTYLMGEIEDRNEMSITASVIQPESYVINRPSPRSIEIPLARHLFNATYTGTANALIPITAYSEFKVNVLYGHDETTQDYDMLRRLAAGDNQFLEIFEKSHLRTKTQKLKISAIYENNAPKFYLNDALSYYHDKISILSNTATNNHIVDIGIDDDVFYVHNQLRALFRTESKKTINFSSAIRVGNINEAMDNEYSAADLWLLNEQMKKRYFITRNQIGSSTSLFGQRLSLDVEFNYDYKNLNNNYSSDFEEFKNFPKRSETTYKHAELGVRPRYQVRLFDQRFTLVLGLPLWYRHYSVASNNEVHDNRLVLEPSFALSYKINHRWDTRINLSRSFGYTNELTLYDAPYIQSYRSVYVPSGDLNQRERYGMSASVGYKNLANLVFFNISANYSLISSNYLSDNYNTADWTYVSTKPGDNKGRMLQLRADLSKKISNIRTSISLVPSYTHTTSDFIQQDLPVQNRYSVYNLGLSIDNHALGSLNVIYDISGRLWSSKNSLSNYDRTLKSLSHSLKVYIFPHKQVDISIVPEHTVFELSEKQYKHFYFFDISAGYKLKNVSFTLRANNILNQDMYSLTELSSVNSYSQEMPLRGCQILAAIKLKF